jgi:hypothetical protein
VIGSDHWLYRKRCRIALTDLTGFNIAAASQNPTERAGFRFLLALLIVLLSDTPW